MHHLASVVEVVPGVSSQSGGHANQEGEIVELSEAFSAVESASDALCWKRGAGGSPGGALRGLSWRHWGSGVWAAACGLHHKRLSANGSCAAEFTTDV